MKKKRAVKVWPCEHIVVSLDNKYQGFQLFTRGHSDAALNDRMVIPVFWTCCPICGAKRPLAKWKEGM